VGGASSPAARKPACMQNPRPQTNDLRVVHRNGVDSCPFRFESPLSRTVTLDGATPNFSDYGTALR
jgi:hypothetical protein